MSAKTAFEFIELPEARSTSKPRRSGLTSVIDYGIPVKEQTDFLQITGHLVDIAKIATATTRVYGESLLLEKLKIYKAADILTQLGGQITEYTFATQGADGVRTLFSEARDLGFEIVEISDCCRPISHDDRRELVEIAQALGLRVVCEVGGYEGDSNTNKMIADAQFALDLDVDYVIVEGAELVGADGFKQEVVDQIRGSLAVDRLLFEMPGPGISDASPAQLEALKRGLILEFGPDVCLGNLLPHEVIETEVVRIGIEDCNAWPQ